MDAARPRHLHLESIPNVRELGGYSLAGGRRVRRGLLWRAGSPRELTDEDSCALTELGIVTFYDLRTDEELREGPPDVLVRNGVRWVQSSIASDPFAVHRSAFPTSEDYTRAYVAMLDASRPALATLLGAVASTGGPLMFGCTLGKDRTGVVAALLLLALGAPASTIADDYAATACCLGRHAHRLQWLADQKNVSLDELTRRTRTEARTMLAFLVAFAEAHGDSDHYLASCGVDHRTVDAFRARISEPSEAE